MLLNDGEGLMKGYFFWILILKKIQFEITFVDLTENIRNDKEVTLAAVKQFPQAWKYVSSSEIRMAWILL